MEKEGGERGANAGSSNMGMLRSEQNNFNINSLRMIFNLKNNDSQFKVL